MRITFRTVTGTIILVLAGCYAFFALRGSKGLAAVREKQEQIRALREQNANLMRDIDMKRERIAKLKESRSEQELEIRRRLKLLKQKETTFILQDQPGTKPSPSQ
jgi:cell division protein FtsB